MILMDLEKNNAPQADGAMPREGELDCSVRYSDEFYERYVQNFHPNTKKDRFIAS